jgi:hypothetical protein
VRERKGTKGSERVIGKAAGDERVFIPGEGPGWQMRLGPTPYQTRQAARWSPKVMHRVTIDGVQTAL